MPVIWRLTFLFCILFIINSNSASPVEKTNDEPSGNDEAEPDEKVTASPKEGDQSEDKVEEVEKNLEDETKETEAENTEKESEEELPDKEEELTENKNADKFVSAFDYLQILSDEVDKELAKTKSTNEFHNFVRFFELFDEVKSHGTFKKEQIVKKTPAELKEMKDETFGLINELNKKNEQDEVSHEEFNKVWIAEEKENGEYFPGRAERFLVRLRRTAEEVKSQNATDNVSEETIVSPTETSDIVKEESPEGAFVVRNAKRKICILAKFKSSVTITYPGKASEQKIEVKIPHSGHAKGKCRGPNGSALFQITWEKFIFSLHFNKTTEDAWGVTLVELTYDTSEHIFDGASEREKITAQSKKVNLFETPYGKSYFCPGEEVILLYREDKHVATVRMEGIHLQPYDIEDGKFSSFHRCDQVVIGEEPFVQDETVPLAVGCTLALITLLILVGFSVHRAYNAAKVDYNTVE